MSWQQGFDEGAKPLKNFLLKFAREKDIQTCVEMTKSAPPRNPADLDLKVLIPAYILSELKTGFQIGAVSVSAVPDHRSGGGFHHAFHRHGAVAARDDLGAVQDSAVRPGGRLESGDRLASKNFLLRIYDS